MAEEPISLRRSLAWGVMAFGAALAVVIGIRLEKAALTAVVGVVCGVGASIPTSLLIVMLLHKKDARREEKRRHAAAQSPPVVVVTPQMPPQIRQPGPWPDEYTLAIPSQRQFSVIGEEETKDL